MGRQTFPTYASDVTLAAAALFLGPFAAANLIWPFIPAAAWCWVALAHEAIQMRVCAGVALGWQFAIAVIAAADDPNADHGNINVEGPPVGPAPANAADVAIVAIEDEPTAESPLISSLRGILGDETEEGEPVLL